MKKITITFNSDENLEYIQNALIDISNNDIIVDLLPCHDEENEELNYVNYNIEENK
tara:strand:+ start:18 stop:185 length:168 start_codon:yes stop_codon:yes gene_type:complete